MVNTNGIGRLAANVTACTGNTVSPIVLTFADDHGLDPGGKQEILVVENVGGNTNANGTYDESDFTVPSPNTISLTAKTGNANWTSLGNIRRDYDTVHAWESGTDEALSTREDGIVFDDYEQFTTKRLGFRVPTSNVLTFAGTTGITSSRYRHLKAAGGYEYDPILKTGCRLICEATETANGLGVYIEDDRTRISNIGFLIVRAPSGVNIPAANSPGVVQIKTGIINCILDGVYVECNVGRDSSIKGFYTETHASAKVNSFRNCIAVGADTLGTGLGAGFTIIDGSVLSNCMAFGIRFADTSHGYVSTFVAPTTATILRNCLAANNGVDFANNLAVVGTTDLDFCGSNDGSVIGVNSFSYLSTSSTYSNAPFGDFRLLTGAPPVDTGENLKAVFNTTITGIDRLGNSPWEMGPYDGSYIRGILGPLTVVTSNIGLGLDYDTVQDWLDGTELHLVALNERHIGVLNVNEDVGVNTLLVQGAVTDSIRYRELRGLTQYNPKGASGILLSGTGTSVIAVYEDFFRCTTLGIAQENSAGSTDRWCVRVFSGKPVWFDAVCLLHESGTKNTVRAGISFEFGEGHKATNLIVIGGGSSGANAGIQVFTDKADIAHCVVDKVRQGSGAIGIFVTASLAEVKVRNCSVAFCDVCFDIPDTAGSYNTSSDTTASGVEALISISRGLQFTDAGNRDFRLPDGSPNIDSATYASVFTDYLGKQRTQPNERGAYDSFVFQEIGPQFGRTLFRRVRCYSIIRRDGFSLFITDHDAPITFRGNTYLPAGGFDSSAQESRGGLEASDTEWSGPVTTDVITLEDLLSGFWEDAQVVTYDINPRFPFASPVDTNVWLILQFSFDSERWVATLTGTADLLEDAVQDAHTRNCPYLLFSQGVRGHYCLLQKASFEVYAVDVATVIDERLSITVTAGTGPGQLPVEVDEYYALGELTWRTGNNTGHTAEVKQYTAATGTITFHIEAPFIIQSTDTFNITPGCDKRRATCKDKFFNIINFGGSFYDPGTDETINSPKAGKHTAV